MAEHGEGGGFKSRQDIAFEWFVGEAKDIFDKLAALHAQVEQTATVASDTVAVATKAQEGLEATRNELVSTARAGQAALREAVAETRAGHDEVIRRLERRIAAGAGRSVLLAGLAALIGAAVGAALSPVLLPLLR